MRILISEGQLENLKKSVNKGEDIDERSRSFAFTRKKRLFSKSERMSNPLRYKFVDRLDDLEKVEIVDQFQNHLLHLNQAIPYNDELYDIAELDFFPAEDDFKILGIDLDEHKDKIFSGINKDRLKNNPVEIKVKDIISIIS